MRAWPRRRSTRSSPREHLREVYYTAHPRARRRDQREMANEGLDEDDAPRRAEGATRARRTCASEIEGQGARPGLRRGRLRRRRGVRGSLRTRPRSARRLISVVRALRSNLGDVDRALAKMDAGTYGTCERCGKPIGPERLEALPWAVLCIDCKQKVGDR